MENKKARVKVTLYQAKCGLCGNTIQGISEEQCRERLIVHINSQCEGASFIRDLGEKGIYKEAIQIMRGDSLARKLKKLLKTYSIEEIQRELDILEVLE